MCLPINYYLHLDCVAATFKIKIVFRPNKELPYMNVAAIYGVGYTWKTTEFFKLSHHVQQAITSRKSYLTSEFNVDSVHNIPKYTRHGRLPYRKEFGTLKQG
jgi:hypothetical protein